MSRSILITGASSGLGAALARAYAADGVRLYLGGRDIRRLEQVAEDCHRRHARAVPHVVDVTDRAAVTDWLTRIDHDHPLDMVIANAGISAGTGGGGESDEQTRQIFAVNVDGVMNTVLPAIRLMHPRRRGQIAIVSSLAGFRGMPGAPAYCASKAAVRIWGEGLRGHLAPQGIDLSVICPGFVRTPMTDVNRFRMPFLMDADRAAEIIKHGLDSNRGRISFPWPMTALTWLAAALPDGLMGWIGAKMPGK